MKKRQKKILWIVLGIITLILVIGLLIPLTLPNDPNSYACTRMMCYPQENSSGISEVECNSCFQSKIIFMTKIFNIYKICSMKEIMIYDGQQFVDTKYSEPSCRMSAKFFK